MQYYLTEDELCLHCRNHCCLENYVHKSSTYLAGRIVSPLYKSLLRGEYVHKTSTYLRGRIASPL